MLKIQRSSNGQVVFALSNQINEERIASVEENMNTTTLSYSITEPALRSPVKEWQPHGKQSESTTEWWYLTAVVHDTAGNPYFLGLVSLPLHWRKG